MSVKIIYFVHGTTTDNEEHKSTGQNPGVLSELGLEQCKELRNKIKLDEIEQDWRKSKKWQPGWVYEIQDGKL